MKQKKVGGKTAYVHMTIKLKIRPRKIQILFIIDNLFLGEAILLLLADQNVVYL